MAVQYILVCICDFIIFPGVYAGIYASGGAFHEWRSLTLQGGGLYHGAMGAICGGTTTERVVERSSMTTATQTNDGAPAQKSGRAD